MGFSLDWCYESAYAHKIWSSLYRKGEEGEGSAPLSRIPARHFPPPPTSNVPKIFHSEGVLSFQDFQRMCHYVVIDQRRPTDRRTDKQTDLMQSQYRALLACRDITGRLTMQTCLGSPEDPII